MAIFDPNKMAVYRLARSHSRAINQLIKTIDTRGFGEQIGQLRRSTASIPANVLEATGEWRPGKRLNYLLIAKGSTWESWAHTDLLVDFEPTTEQGIAEARGLQCQITALLITTIRTLEEEMRDQRE